MVLLYTLIFMMPGIILVAWNVDHLGHSIHPPSIAYYLIYTLIVLPGALSAIIVALLHWLRPRRVFTGYSRRVMRVAALAFIVGVVVQSVCGVWAARMGLTIHESMWLTAGATIICVPLSLLQRRPRPAQTCIRCRYDLRGSLAAGRCPECGMAFDSPASEGMQTATPVGEPA